MTCATHLGPSGNVAAVYPLRELQSIIGTRPANVDPLLRRRAPARDLRLEPQIYNWMAFGIAPGSLPRTCPLTGGDEVNSDGHQSRQG